MAPIIEDDIPATAWSVAGNLRVDAFILLVHQMVFGLVLVYMGYVRVSEGATQMRVCHNFGCQNDDELPLDCPLWCCYGIHVTPFTAAC
jgi:hypothetical protein